MFGTLALVVLLVASATDARAGDEPGDDPLHLRTVEMLEILGSPEPPPRLKDPLSRFIDRLKTSEIGWRPILTFLPPAREALTGEPGEPPMFALVARARGKTLVSVTRPGAKVESGQKLVLQRTLVSDLFEGRSFSLTVYEDHAISSSAARFVGVGARMTLRPTLQVFGWRMRFEMLGSYDLDGGAAAYMAVSGALPPPPLVAPVPIPVR
jgi:hypothetical protein